MQVMGHSGIETPNADIFVYECVTSECEQYLQQFVGINL